MLNIYILLAQAVADPLEEFKAGAKTTSKPDVFGPDVTIVLSVILGLAAVLFFWAFFIRKRPEQARGSLVVQRADKGSGSSRGSGRRRKRRGDHPSSWGRNPTLSETGGLPPPRPEEPQTPASNPPAQ